MIMIYLSEFSFIACTKLEYKPISKDINLYCFDTFFGSLDTREVKLKYRSTSKDGTKNYSIDLK